MANTTPQKRAKRRVPATSRPPLLVEGTVSLTAERIATQPVRFDGVARVLDYLSKSPPFTYGFALALRVGAAYIAGVILVTLCAEYDLLSRPPGAIVGRAGSLVANTLLTWLGAASLLFPIFLWRVSRRELGAPVGSAMGVIKGLVTMFCVATLLDRSIGGQWGGRIAHSASLWTLPHIGIWGTMVAAVTFLVALYPGMLLALRSFGLRSLAALFRGCIAVTRGVVTLSYRGVWTIVHRMRCLWLNRAARRATSRQLATIVANAAPVAVTPVVRGGNYSLHREIATAAAAAPTAPQDQKALAAPTIRTPLVAQVRGFIQGRKEGARRSYVRPSGGIVGRYTPPPIEMLAQGDKTAVMMSEEDYKAIEGAIVEQLASFNIQGKVTERHTGPLVTLYEFQPARGVKVGRITALQDEIAMGLKASAIRVIAPIPGKDTVGIEVPNAVGEVVALRDVIESSEWDNSASSLTIAVGKDACGVPVVLDIAKMPHLLIAGATGTGKSVCINSILLSLLHRASPDELGLILIDPKILELSVYEDIPHLRVPVVTDCRRARVVLDWAVKEMDRRYRLMQHFGVRGIDSYNALVRGDYDDAGVETPPAELVEGGVALPDGLLSEVTGEEVVASPGAQRLEQLPKIVIVIDELADLMFQVGRDVEELITRLAQKARAAGIHLVVATQRPSVDVVTGLIKANFPARMSFRVASRIDSRTILDSMGAERLLGRGDMLLMLPGAGPLRRVHGAFVADDEVVAWVMQLKRTGAPRYDPGILALYERELAREEGEESGADGDGASKYDPQYDQAVELVVAKGQASTSMIQRALRIGYNRAARLIEQMEREGVVGPMDGVKPREVLVGKIPAHGTSSASTLTSE